MNFSLYVILSPENSIYLYARGYIVSEVFEKSVIMLPAALVYDMTSEPCSWPVSTILIPASASFEAVTVWFLTMKLWLRILCSGIWGRRL